MSELQEIDRLTAKAHDLSASAATWTSWYIFFVALTVVLAAATFITQFVASRRSSDLATVQEALIDAKDRLAAADSKTKDVRIADALNSAAASNKAASLANEKAGKANAAAATANERTEHERLARLDIQRQVAAREIAEPDRVAIAAMLKEQFTASLQGRKVTVFSRTNDEEGATFALEIIDILNRAGITVDGRVSTDQGISAIMYGTFITGPYADLEFVTTFSSVLREKAHTDVTTRRTYKSDSVSIDVGAKPRVGNFAKDSPKHLP